MDLNSDHINIIHVDLPNSNSGLDVLSQRKLQVLEILEWFQNQHSDQEYLKLLEFLEKFDPQQELVLNSWLQNVSNCTNFQLMIRLIKKEPEYVEYFKEIIKKQKKDGYNSNLQEAQKQGTSSEIIEADCLFLESNSKACRILGLKSSWKCLNCFGTDCTKHKQDNVPVDISTSPEILAKLFSLLTLSFVPSNILVLGSGLGGVTYCSHLFLPSQVAKIISLEASPELRSLQNDVITKHGMNDKVIVGDLDFFNLLHQYNVDLVILCHRLLITTNETERETIFTKLKKGLHVKSGTIKIILWKKIEDWIKDAKILKELKDWLVIENTILTTNSCNNFYNVYKIL